MVLNPDRHIGSAVKLRNDRSERSITPGSEGEGEGEALRLVLHCGASSVMRLSHEPARLGHAVNFLKRSVSR